MERNCHVGIAEEWTHYKDVSTSLSVLLAYIVSNSDGLVRVDVPPSKCTRTRIGADIRKCSVEFSSYGRYGINLQHVTLEERLGMRLRDHGS